MQWTALCFCTVRIGGVAKQDFSPGQTSKKYGHVEVFLLRPIRRAMAHECESPALS
jgi:hypothetical protein